MTKAGTPSGDPRWVELYLDACHQRRLARLQPHGEQLRRVVFTKHYDLGGSHYAYTEGQSDAQNERHFVPGAALCLLELDGGEAAVRTLLADAHGVIRDPDVSCDGKRILFSWKKSLDADDYHLYEMTAGDDKVRQITSGLGFADYEGAYLPGGDIIFNSTRCVQTVDCWWTEVSNLYTCDRDGRFLRQLSFDQVHTNYPTVTPDGRVLYTRWDYNDRGQIYPQGLFQMNPDGTGQTALLRQQLVVPDHDPPRPRDPRHRQDRLRLLGASHDAAGLAGNPRSSQGARGEPRGATDRADPRHAGRSRRRLWAVGRPVSVPVPAERDGILVGAAAGRCPAVRHLLDVDRGPAGTSGFGRACLLQSAGAALPAARAAGPSEPRGLPQGDSTVYLHDVLRGPGLAGVDRERVKSLRVVALEFRAAGIGSNQNAGPAGGALASTPISIQGAWDVKRVLGTAKVHEDGSACFTVPARTPVYFQALDDKGQAIQTMRSWVSLQPGESVSCVGCHEHKNAAPPVTGLSRALAGGPKPLEPFYGPPRGFSFVREVQPILDKHCVRCHYLDEPPRYAADDPADSSGEPPPRSAPLSDVKPAFSLKGVQTLDPRSAA